MRLNGLSRKASVNIRMHAVYSIEGLVQKQANGATGIDPGRTIRIQVRVVPHNREEINYHEHEAGEGDLPNRGIRFVSYTRNHNSVA